MEIKLHTCTISRKGKAAKGTVDVETFGIPVKPKKGITTKKWDYDFVDSISVRDCIDALESIGKANQRLIKEAILRGFDAIRKSNWLQQQSQKSALVRFILESDLAMDLKSAENVAISWQQTQSLMKRNLLPIPTIEDLAEARKKLVDDMKSKGTWATALVTSEEMLSNDDEESEDDEDTEE